MHALQREASGEPVAVGSLRAGPWGSMSECFLSPWCLYTTGSWQMLRTLHVKAAREQFLLTACAPVLCVPSWECASRPCSTACLGPWSHVQAMWTAVMPPARYNTDPGAEPALSHSSRCSVLLLLLIIPCHMGKLLRKLRFWHMVLFCNEAATSNYAFSRAESRPPKARWE